ncbi:YeeE/YedE family protein [Leclercia adecarboxylata]|uniref:YeeE/YedE family protein n=1 Tax=Leclercia adecarboxylata TaxID=83655 RepID=UPI002DBC82D9|nr:YeeE/YedE family protein [Leclercia adecarboxylata]MEB6377622.1 YeeE/YedE family protein [Leclercia adecarboxylata]
MTIDLSHFTPLSSLGGGVLIGFAAVLLIHFCGRIAGISGILAGMLTKQTRTEGWRMAFLAGLIGSPLLYSLYFSLPEISVETSWPLIIVAGLLVGAGTRLGAGCTSGHGVCGLSRFSKRSLVATLTFMAVGITTATLIGFWLG